MFSLSRFLNLGIAIFFIGVLGFIVSLEAFYYFGFLIGLIVLLFYSLLGLAVIMRFLVISPVYAKFIDQILANAKRFPRKLIVRDPKNPQIWYFNENGDVILTQYGAYFIYGHPLALTKKVVIINMLSSKDILSPVIIIDGLVEWHAKECYVETSHKIILKNGNPSSYADLKFYVTSDDMVQDTADLVKKALTMNPSVLKEKTKPTDFREIMNGGDNF